MRIFKNFTIIKKLSVEQAKLVSAFDTAFIADEDGHEWYECQKFFDSDTWKIVINESGRVISFSKDASSLFPMNSSVIEVPEIPDGLSISDIWYFQVESSTFKKDEIAQAELKREILISNVTLKMAPFFQAQEDGDITKVEEDYLTALKNYRAALRRLVLVSAPSIDWPVEPQSL